MVYTSSRNLSSRLSILMPFYLHEEGHIKLILSFSTPLLLYFISHKLFQCILEHFQDNSPWWKLCMYVICIISIFHHQLNEYPPYNFFLLHCNLHWVPNFFPECNNTYFCWWVLALLDMIFLIFHTATYRLKSEPEDSNTKLIKTFIVAIDEWK